MTTVGPWRKASRSTNNGSACVEARMVGYWRTSSRSGGTSGSCVDARLSGRLPQLSDSKLAGNRPILTIDESVYTRFIADVKSGRFDASN